MHKKWALIYQEILNKTQKKGKGLVVLIDPESSKMETLDSLVPLLNTTPIDFLFVGGSFLFENEIENCLTYLKTHTSLPILLFPGDLNQINPKADGILLLSLISGRNPDLLIGKHVVAAPLLKNSGLEILSTGYMLIEGGQYTTAHYMSQTPPLPREKPEIAAATALAAQMLGMKLIYMDAGSGAKLCIPENLIAKVRETVDLPIIVGGGIDSIEKAERAWKAGADFIVIGNVLEKNPRFLETLFS